MNDQTIYNKAYALIEGMGFTVYPYKQMNDVGYPFVEMANTSIDRRATKSGSLQTIELSIDIWGLASNRQEVSAMKSKIINKLIEMFQVKESQIEERILIDTTTNDVLFHGVLVVPIYLH